MHPPDEYNQKLLANVHPEEWTNPRPSGRYNLVVVGAGTAGLIAASGSAGLGAKVALIERNLMGGDCLNVGCVPSKALIRSAHAITALREAGRFGISTGEEATVDFAEVMRRMRKLRSDISPIDSAHRYRDELGIDVFIGDASFTSRSTVLVAGQTLEFAKAVIATGARAFVPEIPGLAEAGFRTNETIFELTELPRRLLVLGGGPIGCELAQAFRRLGSEVHLVELDSQFLRREDADAAAVLAAAFERDGIDVRLATEVVEIEAGAEGRRVVTQRGGTRDEFLVDEILVSIGRLPNVEGLGLEAAGVEYDSRTGIRIDDHLRTTNKKIFAAGDIALRTQFTHAADFTARAVVRNALFYPSARLSDLTIPWCTYTDPEIAHVGIYPRDAEERGIEIDSFTREFSDVDRARLDGATEGFVKVHVARGKDRILGATIVGKRAGDLIGEISVAMAGEVGLAKLSGVIHPYPTQAEAIRQVGDVYMRTRLTPFVKWLFARIMALRR